MTRLALVTGAQGYLGRYTVASLLARGATVVGTGRSPAQNESFSYDIVSSARTMPAPLPVDLRNGLTSERYSYLPCDLADAEAVAAQVMNIRPNQIIHLAGALRDEPWPVLARANIMATLNLALAAADLRPPPQLIVGSTGSVYGDQPPGAICETAQPKPIGPYATSKLMAELAALEVGRTAGMAISIARIFNLIGPGLQQRHLAGQIAHQIAEIELGRSPPELTLGDISTVRDFIDVRDAAAALAEWPCDAPDIVNLGAGACTVRDIVDQMLSAATCPITVQHDADRSRPGAQSVVADRQRLNLFAPPKHGIDASVRDTLQYARLVEQIAWSR